VSTQAAAAPAPRTLESGMTHREVLEAMSGLLLGMFVAILSSTVVSTALPEIIGDLGGSQSSYTWVVTATLLALTVSMPVWGKLADSSTARCSCRLAWSSTPRARSSPGSRSRRSG
jgi:MFS family permease